jgi:hypothetical protein
VAAVIREAIDQRFPDDGQAARAQAARRFLDMTAVPLPGPAMDAADYKREYEAELIRNADTW